ncbi:MAG: hypothetical protein O2807_09635 [bacterium]|nr:hypothetical protein [bacterium]
MNPKNTVTENHPLGRHLRMATESAFDVIRFRDGEIIEYVWRLLLRFAHVDNLFRCSPGTGERLERVLDFLVEAEGRRGASLRELKLQMGDVCLFFTGLYPENLQRKKLNPEFYVSQGKAAYCHVADIDGVRPSARLFRKLTDEFDTCVSALRLEREFLFDSFYQYIGRQFSI